MEVLVAYRVKFDFKTLLLGKYDTTYIDLLRDSPIGI